MISPTLSQCRTASDVAIVVPPIVASSVSRSTTFRYGAGFSAILREGRRASATLLDAGGSARTRFVRVIATSVAALNATTTISRTMIADLEPVGRTHGTRTPL